MFVLLFTFSFSADFVYRDENNTILIECTTTLSSIIVPYQVITVRGYSFLSTSCPNLRTLTFESSEVHPSQLQTIDSFAFDGTAITSITLPPVSISLGSSTFRNAEKLETVTFQTRPQSIPNSCFALCPNLQSVSIEGTLLISQGVLDITRMSDLTFSMGALSYSSITSATIPSSWNNETYYISLFSNCEKLKTVVFNYDLTYIPTACFDHCLQLDSVKLPNSFIVSNRILDLTYQGCTVKALNSRCFSETSLVKVLTPAVFNNISNDAFVDCYDLQSIRIQSPFYTYPHPDFQGMSSLVECYIGNYHIVNNKVLDLTGTNLTYIDAYEFSETDFIEVVLPEVCIRHLTSCFQGCRDLRKVTLSRIAEFSSYNIFSGCESLQTINFGSTPVLKNGVLDFSPISLRNVNIGTFEFSPFINKVVVCESLVLMKNSLRMSFSLTVISITSSSFDIREDAFRECPSIQRIEFSNNVSCQTFSLDSFQKAFRLSNIESLGGWCNVNLSPTPGDNSGDDSESGGLSGGIIALIVIIVIIAVIAIGVGVWWFLTRKTNMMINKDKQFSASLKDS